MESALRLLGICFPTRSYLATAASLIESFLPIDLACNERCENDVFKASNKFTTILIN